MPVKKDARRKEKLAAALKENLRRRKAQARLKGAAEAPPAKSLGTAPQAGLESAPESDPASHSTPAPDTASKRR